MRARHLEAELFPFQTRRFMDIRDYITPKSVLVVLGIAFLLTIAIFFIVPHTHQSTVWTGFMDLVVVISLLVTIAVLSDLKEIQRRYLLRATIDSLQETIRQRAENLGDLLRSGPEDSRSEIAKELSKAEGMLKTLADRTEAVDMDIHREAKDLREEIKAYSSAGQTDADKLYDIWQSTHTLNELVKGLIEESKWKR